MKYKNILFLGLIIPALLMTGCNTIRGIGEDLEAAGEAIQRQSEEQQSD